MTSLDASSPLPVDTQRQLAYLQSVVSTMPQGISVFDENLRLRVWNRGFLEALDLPADAITQAFIFPT